MKNLIERISILGCGWLGLPLAEQLVTAGYQVAGSTTTFEKLEILRQKNILPYQINLLDQANSETLLEFLETDCLIISFPPRLRAGLEKEYLPQIHFLKNALDHSSVKFVLFISSTSVYRDVNQVITENEPSDALDLASPLYQAEEIIRESSFYQTTVLRFGGLVGGSRQPGRFLAGKTQVPQPEAPVNLIHLNDCVGIIGQIISQRVFNEMFHAAADKHPSRQHFYTAAAQALNLEPPQFTESGPKAYKIISNAKLKAQLAYEFIYPDPMFFF
ncbi:SDR family oxidoreductase [Adhaeribacter pallidiroseus]|uniref:Protein YeeZ n=1 Tax=Adhaeribacter pallidiroseus TaxID=2072847 RepID=A0A369QLG0_9BACT|nr:SDR family oxidoreductase [Adhaeribacter pallidiroseus]RDC63098.1 Protein YeeZ [Adhaeribacter pallidiroseus]